MRIKLINAWFELCNWANKFGKMLIDTITLFIMAIYKMMG